MGNFKKGDVVLIIGKFYLSSYMKIAIVQSDQESAENLIQATYNKITLAFASRELVKITKAQEYLYAD